MITTFLCGTHSTKAHAALQTSAPLLQNQTGDESTHQPAHACSSYSHTHKRSHALHAAFSASDNQRLPEKCQHHTSHLHQQSKNNQAAQKTFSPAQSAHHEVLCL